MGLGEKARKESFRIHLTFQGAAPTGTPQILIEGPLYLIDLATDGAGTGISSATGGFEAGMVGGYLYIDSGLGFAAGSYLITVYTDTNNITIGSSAGANATLGVGIINNKTILAAVNMVQGVSVYDWYYDYIIAVNARAGLYQVIRSAVIGGTTYYAIESYDVSIAANVTTQDSDDIYE